jgi:pilus assembly protein CpaE
MPATDAARSLRICVISPEPRHIERVLSQLQALPVQVLALHGMLATHAARAADDAPDLLVADLGDGDGPDPLAPLRACAGMPVLLLCRRQDPAFLLAAMRAGVREVLPLPSDGGLLQAAVARICRAGGQGARSAARGKVLAFVSCKGGSGATFLAANLAYALAAGGSRTALLDFNLQFGDALLFLSDRRPVRTLADLARAGGRLDATFLAASMTEVGPLGVLAGAEDPAQAVDVLPEHIDALLALARSRYEFVVVDVGRGLDARSLRTLDQADFIYPVLQITLPFIRDGHRLLEVFRGLDYPADKVRIVVNRHEKRGDIGIAQVERTLGTAVSRAIPNHYAGAAASVNQGIPMVALARGNPISRALLQWGGELGSAPVRRTGLRRWWGR